MPTALINGDRINNGAMDNASGIATLIETAAALDAANTKLGRSVLFVAVTNAHSSVPVVCDSIRMWSS